MKKLVATMLTLVLIVSGIIFIQPVEQVQAAADVWDGTVNTSWYNAESPLTQYTLDTAEELAGLATLVNGGTSFADTTIYLGADIILNAGSTSDLEKSTNAKNWTAIGTNSNKFEGNFDGQGHTISGMYLSNAKSSEPQGFFGYVNHAKAGERFIQDISIINSYIKDIKQGKTGMLVGYLQENATSDTTKYTIENIYTQGKIDCLDTTYKYQINIGGVCGYSVTTSSKASVEFLDNVADVDINFGTGSYGNNKSHGIGGIVGFLDKGNTTVGTRFTFNGCVNLGNLTHTLDTDNDKDISAAGSIVGVKAQYNDISITDCLNAGNITCPREGGAIGSVNYNTATIKRFVTVGQLAATNSCPIYGHKGSSPTISTSDSYALTGGYSQDTTSLTYEQLISATAFTDTENPLSSSTLKDNGWIMVAGFAPFPSKAAEVCGFVFDSASLTLNSSLQMNFKVVQNNASSYAHSKVVFALGDDVKEVSTYEAEEKHDVYRLEGVAPYQMGETITATLHFTYGGKEYTSATPMSISEYCYTLLNSDAYNSNECLRTLVVDLLNYGTESQIRDGQTSGFVNGNLTDDQKGWASTDGMLQTVKNADYVTIDNPSVTWQSAGLNLLDRVIIRLKFSAESTEGLYVRFSDAADNNYQDVTEFTEVSKADNSYYVYLDTLNAHQMSDTICATVYDSQGNPVSNTLSYSIESYAYDAQSVDDGNLGNLVKAMMRYGNSANAYKNYIDAR